MIELRADGTIPGPDQYGRVYQMADEKTGKIFYNVLTSDRPLTAADFLQRERYIGFVAWASAGAMSSDEALGLCATLNKTASQHPRHRTPHVIFVERVNHRLTTGNDAIIDGHSALDDMLAMKRLLMTQRDLWWE